MNMKELEQLLKDRGVKKQDLAVLLGRDNAVISNIFSGKRPLKVEEAKAIANHLEVPLTGIIGADIPIVGSVGAGAEVFACNDLEDCGGFESVPMPPELPPGKYVAVKVEGDSMYPKYEEGDTLIYKRDFYGVTDDCIGRYCIAQVKDGPILVKKIRRGSEEGMFDLHSVNAPPREDVILEWCAPVSYSKQG